jgi:hypothetical protein
LECGIEVGRGWIGVKLDDKKMIEGVGWQLLTKGIHNDLFTKGVHDGSQVTNMYNSRDPNFDCSPTP